jgi:Ca2+-binding EF-hand superfamily protein
MKNFKKYGHPHGILKNTVPPFTLVEVNNLIKYCDPDMDGKLSLEEVEAGMQRAHANQSDLEAEQGVGEILRRLEGRFHQQGAYGRVRELFDHLDIDGSGEITLAELRKGLQKWNQKTPKVIIHPPSL